MVDPITLTGLALAGAAGAAGASLSGGDSAPSTAPAPQAAPPPQAPTPKKQQQSTFIGGVPAPPTSTGQKTLLGQ